VLSFCFKLSTAALEMHEMLKGKISMERCSLIKCGEMSLEGFEQADCPSAGCTDENVQRNTTMEFVGRLGLSHGTC
jgi:hypothetical protein